METSKKKSTKQTNVNAELIAYQLTELLKRADEQRNITEQGFARIDSRQSGLELRVGKLEVWKSATNERLKQSPFIPDQPNEKSSKEIDFNKIIIGLITIIGSLIAYLAASGGK